MKKTWVWLITESFYPRVKAVPVYWDGHCWWYQWDRGLRFKTRAEADRVLFDWVLKAPDMIGRLQAVRKLVPAE